jgi:hypothetical protein
MHAPVSKFKSESWRQNREGEYIKLKKIPWDFKEVK